MGQKTLEIKLHRRWSNLLYTTEYRIDVWKRVYDENTGCYYLWNKINNDTKWDDTEHKILHDNHGTVIKQLITQDSFLRRKKLQAYEYQVSTSLV